MSFVSIAREDEDTQLLGDGVTSMDGKLNQQIKLVFNNFLLMAVATCIHYSAIFNCVTYAGAEFGTLLGSYSMGWMFFFFVLSTIVLAKPAIALLGPRQALFYSCIGLVIYLFGFLISILISYLAWPIYLLASAIGGLSFGVNLVSQSTYYARNAKLYSSITGFPSSQVFSNFACIFGALTLFIEMFIKIFTSTVFLSIPANVAEFIIFTSYFGISIATTLVIASLSELEEFGNWTKDVTEISSHVSATAKLIMEDRRLQLVLPFQIAYGFTSSFIPFYVFGTIVYESYHLGTRSVGFLTSVILLFSAITAIASAFVSNRFGKPIVTIMGGSALVATGVILYLQPDITFSVPATMIPYLITYSIGRGFWVSSHLICILYVLYSDIYSLNCIRKVLIKLSLQSFMQIT